MFVNKSSRALVGKPGTAKCGGSCRVASRRAGVRAEGRVAATGMAPPCVVPVSVSVGQYTTPRPSVRLSVCVLSDNRE